MRFTEFLILVTSVLGDSLRSEDASLTCLPVVQNGFLVTLLESFAWGVMIGLGVFRSRVSAFLPAKFVRVSDIRGLISRTCCGLTLPLARCLGWRSIRPVLLGLCGRFRRCFLAEVRLQEDPDRYDRGVRPLEFAAEFHRLDNRFECSRVGRFCSS